MQKSPSPVVTQQTDAPRRGRPREFDREAALGRAMRLFWSKGYEATSIADLMAVMGIGAPSLYATFRSKEALYAEAIRHYGETQAPLIWNGFETAPTAREAVAFLLMNSAGVLSGAVTDVPRGCMVALSSVAGEGHEALGELVRSERAIGLERLESRFERAAAEGEIPLGIGVHGLARFIQAVYNGMSLLARDGASRADLEEVARTSLMVWDVRLGA
ncbi:TetR/AcrR family transcriptional regulator [Caulobacter soli]|uniref:TetR/AcrR family transcriptional regulator n=1 Tax=Caulobacter soli TaxID=2708539 RepID=UPI0013EA1797|nr:TetR/AcrR family transcriptional regulator [Caulobacter soli]